MPETCTGLVSHASRPQICHACSIGAGREGAQGLLEGLRGPALNRQHRGVRIRGRIAAGGAPQHLPATPAALAGGLQGKIWFCGAGLELSPAVQVFGSEPSVGLGLGTSTQRMLLDVALSSASILSAEDVSVLSRLSSGKCRAFFAGWIAAAPRVTVGMCGADNGNPLTLAIMLEKQRLGVMAAGEGLQRNRSGQESPGCFHPQIRVCLCR